MNKFILYIRKKTSRTQFLILACVLVGWVIGIEAIILKSAVYYLHSVFYLIDDYFIQSLITFAAPLLGIIIVVFIVQKIFKGKLGRGIANILYEIAKKNSIVHRDKAYSHVITSAITVGLGGSAGLEAPIVITGAAVGSNVARTFHFNYRDRTLLLGCGVAAGIAAVFNAPIAGVIFVIEVILKNIRVKEFIPLIISSVTGALLSKIVLKEDILLSFDVIRNLDYMNIPFYILLGIILGFMSLYYAKMNTYIESVFKKSRLGPYGKAIVGGLALSFLIFMMPPLFGEGYGSIKMLAAGKLSNVFNFGIYSKIIGNEWFYLFLVGIIALIKVVATSLTISSGGNGGHIAPALFVGAYSGYFFSSIFNKLNITELPVGHFTIVAMGGVLSGLYYAPFTGIFLIAEITGGYHLFIPLMIVSSISYLIAKHYEPFPMDEKKLAAKGNILTDDSDKNILTIMSIDNIIENDLATIKNTATLGDLVEVVKHSHRNTFVVLDEEGNLQGLIDLDDVREIMFNEKLYSLVIVQEIMKKPREIIDINESMTSVMNKFEHSGAWLLPVVDNGKYVGCISKTSMFNEYRKMLKFKN
jgi:CIC family chloride channel protein